MVLMALDSLFRITTRHMKWLIAATIVVVGISWTVYVAMRIRVTYQTHYAVQQLQRDLEALVEENRVYHNDQAQRINDIERIIYTTTTAPLTTGTPTANAVTAPSVRTRVSPAQWQANRDAELRKRLQDVEQRQVQRDAELHKRLQMIEEWLRVLSKRNVS